MAISSEHAQQMQTVRAALASEYDVLEELGRGGMAIVYRARERGLDREVAIKVLPPALTTDQGFVERFQHEARTAGRLEHPNIVPIYRVGRAGDVIYFVMKLLRGQSLGAVLRERGELEPPEVRRILLETGSALGYAAKRSVVHRDIKPDNILLDQEGRCVVTDFGIAKTPGGQQTAAGTSLGTPRYMSPEHAQGVSLDGRSDMYSLGVVAYQCLTGHTPFDSDDPFAVLYKHINEPLPEPPLESEDERDLYAVIAKMLAKKPDDRYQSGDALIAALGGDVAAPTLVGTGVVSSEGLLVATQIILTPAWTRARRYLPKDWRVSAVAAAVLVLAVGSGVARSALGPSVVVDSLAVRRDTLSLARAAFSLAPAVVVPPRPAPAPEPYSRCPRVDSAAVAKGVTFSLLVDTVKPQKPGGTLTVSYDVCGLAKGSAFTTVLTLRKTRQSRFKKIVGATQEPVSMRVSDKAIGPRTRRRRAVDLKPLSEGTYELEVAVMDTRGRRRDVKRSFELGQ